MGRLGALRTAAAAILATTLPACGGSDWTIAAEKSLDWTTKTETEASIFALLYGVITVDPAGPGIFDGTSAEEYAANAKADVEARLGGCVTTTTTGSKNTYSFMKCGAARGFGAVDGQIAATYLLPDISGNMIGVNLAGQGVALDDARLDLALAGGNAFPATAWSMPPENRTAFRLAETSPPTSNADNRDALLDLLGDLGDQGCGDPVGNEQSPAGITSAHGFVSVDDGEAWTIAASAYHRCGGACPAAGGSIQISLSERVSVRFDGTAVAHAENLTTGDAVDVDLDCAP